MSGKLKRTILINRNEIEFEAVSMDLQARQCTCFSLGTSIFSNKKKLKMVLWMIFCLLIFNHQWHFECHGNIE